LPSSVRLEDQPLLLAVQGEGVVEQLRAGKPSALEKTAKV
jgi:hypothetical protein